MFSVTRVYSNSDFEDMKIPLTHAGSVVKLSDELPAKGVMFHEV